MTQFANPEWSAANQPNCHRCGRPCVQGKFGSWMCDCSSTPLDERDICPKCKEPINDNMGHMCP